jgi:hypothetical protein
MDILSKQEFDDPGRFLIGLVAMQHKPIRQIQQAGPRMRSMPGKHEGRHTGVELAFICTGGAQ